MAYIGNSPGVASQRVVTTFTATAGQTTFTPSSGYTLGYCDVFFNGVKLVNGDDYTASNGTSVVLASAAAAGDSVEIVAHFPRGLSDGYLKAEADALLAAKQNSLGYTPVNKAGDTMGGTLRFPVGEAAFRYSDGEWLLGAVLNGSGGKSLSIGSASPLASGNTFDLLSGGLYTIRMDAAGRVTMPYQPCAIVKLDNDNSQGGQNSTVGPTGNNASGSIIKFENLVRNTGGHYSASTGQFTCPVAGVYHVLFSSNINTSNGGFPIFPMIYRNNVTYLRSYDGISVSGWSHQQCQALVNCGAGDTLDIRLLVTSGYAWADSDVDYTQASFMLVG